MFRIQNYDRALKCLQNAKGRNPRNSDVRATMGMIYHIQNKTAAAISEYLYALENTQDHAAVNELLQLALAEKRKIEIPFSEEEVDFSKFDFENLPDISDEIQLELDDDKWH